MANPINHVSTFSTDDLPDYERFDQFRDEFARRITRLDVRQRGDGPFHARMRSSIIGNVGFLTADYSAASYGRTADLMGDGKDYFAMQICVSNAFHEASSERTFAVGEARLLDNTACDHIANDTGGAMVIVWAPRKAVLALVPEAEDLTRSLIVRDQPELRLLKNYVTTLLDTPNIDAKTLAVAGNHVVDLFALTLGGNQDAGRETGPSSLRAARSLAVRQSIEARLHDAALTLPDIAMANGISERYVQRLFEDMGTNFTDYVLNQRTERVHGLLLNPMHGHRLISDIAFGAGFGDLSHFNRSFRQRYGMTPSEARAVTPR